MSRLKQRCFSFSVIFWVNSALASGAPPNMVVILVDDTGYKDFGFQESTISTTPNIDLLANQGTIFTEAYVTNGLCTPSRAGMLLGRYNSGVGLKTK